MKNSIRYILIPILLATAVFCASFMRVSAFTGSNLQGHPNIIIRSPETLIHPMLKGGADLSEYLFQVKNVKKAHRNLKKGKRPSYKHYNKRIHKKRKEWRKNARRRYWGAVVGGVVLGATINAIRANNVPPRPSNDLCWTWVDAPRTRGYWYYCYEPY